MSPESIKKTQTSKLEKEKIRASFTGSMKDSISQKTRCGDEKMTVPKEDMGATKDMILSFPNDYPAA